MWPLSIIQFFILFIYVAYNFPFDLIEEQPFHTIAFAIWTISKFKWKTENGVVSMLSSIFSFSRNVFLCRSSMRHYSGRNIVADDAKNIVCGQSADYYLWNGTFPANSNEYTHTLSTADTANE